MKFGSFKPHMLMFVPLFVLLTAPMVFAQSIRPDAPKQDGTTRVGLVTPKVTLIGGGGSVAQEATALRKSISSYLSGPRIGTIDIRAKLDALAVEEAKERECDFVLFISLTRKRKSAPGATGGGGYGGGTKAGDEFIFESKVVPTDASQSSARTLKGTVTADGDDVLTSMVETTAQAVVGLAKTARPVQSAGSGSGPGSGAVQPDAKPNIQAVAPTPESSNSPVNTPPTGYGSLSASPRNNSKATTDQPKAPGTIRIGIVLPRVVGGGPSSGSGDAASLRQTIVSYLGGSNIETIELKARLDGLALTEAQKRDCDFVLYTTLTRKRKASSTGSGPLSGILGSIGGGSGVGKKVPGTKTAKEIGSEAARIGGGISSLAKANDEMTFDYKLVTSGEARSVAQKTTTAKVKADGDDVLTPMIESAAQAIVDATQKK